MLDTKVDLKAIARHVLEIESEAVKKLTHRIDDTFIQACDILLACKGRVVVTGMGKSGHIGGKIAATLASTGSPAFFVHPGEASHGDLGMITVQDVIIALSNSGETEEILTILPLLKRNGIALISLTGNPHSTLAQQATVNLDVSVEREACALGLAPTASTTAVLAMGDAIAVALLEAKGFTARDFALAHPGGSLGRRLLLKIDDIMHTGNDVPKVSHRATLKEALIEMTRSRLGMTAILDDDHRQIGLFTDGDLRRIFDRGLGAPNTPITDIMTHGGKVVSPGLLAAEALRIMESMKINGLFVVDADKRLLGALNMHDILKAGVL
ncbi:MAG: KpsF/GutQ family sugar-phosphate isomerase [Gammaproteobacteria bacterium]